MIVLYILGGLVVLIGSFVLFFLFGLWHLRRSIRQGAGEIKSVSLDDIPFLAEECVRVFREKFGQELRLDDLESSAWILDKSLRSEQIKKAFQRADFYWYFVKPVGAFTGELLRRNSGGQWQKEAGKAPFLKQIALGRAEVTTRPFEKVLRQVAGRRGNEGDFYAYLKAGSAMNPPTNLADASETR